MVGPAGLVGARSSSSAPLAVSTRSEEELREKLAKANEDLSEVSTEVSIPLQLSAIASVKLRRGRVTHSSREPLVHFHAVQQQICSRNQEPVSQDFPEASRWGSPLLFVSSVRRDKQLQSSLCSTIAHETPPCVFCA